MGTVWEHKNGLYTPAEHSIVAFKDGWKSGSGAADGKVAIIALHGRGGDAYQMFIDFYTAHFARAAVEAGYLYTSIDAAGGFTWSAQVAMDAITAWHTYLQAKYNVQTKAILLGFSMGGLCALNWGRKNKAKTRGIIGICPANNLQVQASVNGTWATEIAAAFGANWQTDGTTLPNFSPYHAAVSSDVYSDVPTKIFYHTDDPAVPASSITDLHTRCPSMNLRSLGTGGHTPIDTPELEVVQTLREMDAAL